MSWLRTGDTAALYPPLMLTGTLSGADERTVNEVCGWIIRCMAQAAGHRTDYLIDMGTAALLGASRTAELIKMCKRVKLIKVVKRDGLEYIEVIDDPNFLHVRLKAEQDAENQRKRDNGNPSLTAPVRLRDGDLCRWCGVATYWGTPDQKSGRAGTYDHLVPVSAPQDGKPPKTTIATMVVACRACNSSRQDDREGWTKELLDPPSDPYYSRPTIDFIAKHLGVQVTSSAQQTERSVMLSQRPGNHPDDAPGDPATSGIPPLSIDDREADEVPFSPTSNGRPGSRPDTAPDDLAASETTPLPTTSAMDADLFSTELRQAQHGLGGVPHSPVQDQLGRTAENIPGFIPGADRPIPVDRSSPGSGFVGSGRVGSGSVGRVAARGQPRAERSRRGRRQPTGDQ